MTAQICVQIFVVSGQVPPDLMPTAPPKTMWETSEINIRKMRSFFFVSSDLNLGWNRPRLLRAVDSDRRRLE